MSQRIRVTIFDLFRVDNTPVFGWRFMDCMLVPGLVLSLTLTMFACGSKDTGEGLPGSRTTGTESDDDTENQSDSQAETNTEGDTETNTQSPCQTILCGVPPVCCTASEECIEGRCLSTCETGIRCGAALETCCDAGQVCLVGTCVDPGESCNDAYDCEQPGEFCEPTFGKCLPQPDPLTCQTMPSFGPLEVMEEWSFETDQIISIPVVADVDGDGHPDVVVNLTRQTGTDWTMGNIVVLDGRTGAEKLRISHDPANDYWGSHGRSTIAIGDVNGDGIPDVIYATRAINSGKSYIVAVEGDGTFIWRAHDAANSPYLMTVVNGAITLANFDNDPMAEIVIGASLIDHNGLVVWDQGGSGNGGSFGSNAGYTGGISAVADLDGDGRADIVSGRNAWKVDWQPGVNPTDSPSVSIMPLWTYSGNDGYPAVADFDGDGQPEVVLVGSGEVSILNGQTGELWCGVDPTDTACQLDPGNRTQPFLLPGGTSQNRGGPPTVADFDGDGRQEIGVAGGYFYTVFDIHRPGEVVVQPQGDPAPLPGAIYVRWKQPTQDLSSNATGSSVFDFHGDGAAEVIYNDECYMRVYSGVDGEVQLGIPNTTSTIVEYPLVVDVDGDGNAEILVVANHHPGCGEVTSRQGLFVYGDLNDRWVPTRKVWTQHAYHVTNAASNGNVPLVESDNWTMPGLNNYRQNVQGDGVFNAPDLAIELTVGLNLCNQQSMLELRARVSNIGALGVLAGSEVTFYRGSDASGTTLGQSPVTVPLLPGSSTVLTLVVPDPETPTAYFATVQGNSTSLIVAECDESNNSDAAAPSKCPVVY